MDHPMGLVHGPGLLTIPKFQQEITPVDMVQDSEDLMHFYPSYVHLGGRNAIDLLYLKTSL